MGQVILHTLQRLAEEVTDVIQLLGKHHVRLVDDVIELDLLCIALVHRGVGLQRVVLLLEDRDLVKDVRDEAIQPVGPVGGAEDEVAKLLQRQDVVVPQTLEILELQQLGELPRA